MIVYKFGGTSLADADRIAHAAGLVGEREGPRVVVVSALAGVTNELGELAALAAAGGGAELGERVKRLGRRHRDVAAALSGSGGPAAELPERLERILARLEDLVEGASSAEHGPREDEIAAIGEDLAAELVAAALTGRGIRARVVDARRVVRTDDRFGAAVPRDEETTARVREVLEPLLEEGMVPVMQGFVGATESGVTTTLGRGGSDFTAAIVGAALNADDVSIWTDVDGVLSADPRQVSAARALPELGYEEAVELAYFGARAIHPAAAKHAAARDLSLRVRNALRPELPGTLIRHDRRRADGVAAVAHRTGITLIKVRSRPMFMAYGFLARVFEVLARHRLPVDLVATSHTSTAFTIDAGEALPEVLEELAAFAEVDAVRELATVTVVGHGLLRRPGLAGEVFSSLGGLPIHLISQASDVSLSFLVDSGSAADAVRRVHARLIEGEGEAA